MAQRKLLSQQKGNLTVHQQEEKKVTEQNLMKLTDIKGSAPEWLDNLATEEWYRILPLIRELPVKELDRALLAMYCQVYSNFIHATKQLSNEMVVETERGSKLSSFYTVQRDAVSSMNSIAPKLGLTVESRLKILAPKEEDKKQDPFEGMLNGKR